MPTYAYTPLAGNLDQGTARWLIIGGCAVILAAAIYLLTRTVWPHRNVRPWRTPAAVKALRARQNAPQAPVRPAWYRGKHRAPEPDPAPAEPDDEPGEVVEHEGATEAWSPAAALVACDLELPPLEFAPSGPDAVHDPEVLAAIDARIGAAVATFSSTIDALLDKFCGEDLVTRERLYVSAERTGEYDLTELRALLAGTPA